MQDNHFKTIFSLYRKESLFNKLFIYLRLKLFWNYFCKIGELLPAQGTIIDLGSGFGLLANYMSTVSPDCNLIGIDSNFKKTKVAQNTIGDRNNIKFFVNDIIKTEEGDLTSDSIIMTDFLHHLNYSQQEALLKKISQSLKKGSLLIIGEVMNKPRWKYFFSYLADLILYPFSPKCFYRTNEEMKKFLEKYSFNVEIIPYHQGNIFATVIYRAQKI